MYNETARAPIGPEMLARKKLGTKLSAVSRPSPLSDEMKMAFHSASFGTMAKASEESVMPVKSRQSCRSTISCALRTQAAGLPAVSSIKSSIFLPSQPPLSFCTLAYSSAPRFCCWPTDPSGPVKAKGMPTLIVAAACACALVQIEGAARAAPVPARTPRREIRDLFSIERFSAYLQASMADASLFERQAIFRPHGGQ